MMILHLVILSGWQKIKGLPMLPQAIICANDSIAINVINAVKYLGLKVPDMIQVVGFDNIVDAEYINPSLTTVNVDKELLERKHFIY